MLSSPALEIVAGCAGALVGSVLVWLAPRLVAYRLDDPPNAPGPLVLVPFLGGRLSGWQPVRTALFESTLVVTFAALAWHYGASKQLLLSCGYSALLLLIAFIDLQHRLVLNRLSYPGIVLSLALSPVWPGLGLVSALLGCAVGLAIFGALQLIGRGALGTGDTKLAFLIGAMRGLPTILNALFLGVLLGGVGALFYLFVLRRGRKESIPYGPYLALGAIASFFLYPP